MIKFIFELQFGNEIVFIEEEFWELIIWCCGDELKVDIIKEFLIFKEKFNEEG